MKFRRPLVASMLLVFLVIGVAIIKEIPKMINFPLVTPYGLCMPRYTLKFRQVDLRMRSNQLHYIQHDLKIPLAFTTTAQMKAYRPTARANATLTSIAIVSIYVPAHLSSLFDSFAKTAICNIQQYAQRHGYPFLYQHHPNALVPTSSSSDSGDSSASSSDVSSSASDVFWGKVALLRHHLSHGPHEWLLWTDLDVLILEKALPLRTFTDPVPPQYHIIAVLECGREDSWYFQHSVRAGFFLVRRSPQSLAFLDAWLGSRLGYSDSPTPDQDAMMMLFADPMWRPLFYVYPTSLLNCYGECYEPGVFSVHFANTQRKECINAWADKLHLVDPAPPAGAGATTRRQLKGVVGGPGVEGDVCAAGERRR